VRAQQARVSEALDSAFVFKDIAMLDIIDHHDGATREIRMARPPVNALNPELVQALHEAISAAPQSGARMLLLSGRTGLFSAGLDVPALLALEPAQLADFWDRFFGLLGCMAASPIPIVAAITGHSPAGGAVLSLYCDYRVMAAGEYRIGLNEVQVGLFVPGNIQYALRRLIGAHRAERMLVEGAMLQSEQALAIGLVDQLCAADEVVAQALSWCERHLKLPPTAMARTREVARADLVDAMRGSLDVTAMTTGWFGEETQSTLRRLFLKPRN
jgi:enoyl-CoA hydratase/carnithine racemase